MPLEFTLGADPEVFAYKPKLDVENSEIIITDAQHRSLIGKLGGTKNKPLPLTIIPEYKDLELTIQEDNVAGELGWKPCKTRNEWANSCVAAWNAFSTVLEQDHLLLHPSTQASVIFPESELNSPGAFVFGCEPDYCAWTGEINPRPHSENPCLRSAGGHIHIGVEASDLEKIRLVKYLDYYVGFALATFDPDVRRRSLYGKAGAMRFKKYGVEYRTPSNYWFVTPDMDKLVYKWVTIALEAWQDKTTPLYFNMVQKALDHTDNSMIMQLHAGLSSKRKVWYA